MSRISLKDQLSQLSDPKPRSIDPESAYSSLDTLDISRKEGDEGREHYLEAGPSSLRKKVDEETSQTLLGEKYEGKRVGRMKIFDDDEEEEEEADEDVAEGSDDEDEDEDDDDDEDEEGDGDEEEEEDDESEDAEEDEEPAQPTTKTKVTPGALDPLGSLRESRMKDIEKGRGIRRQKSLFDSLLTLRITFQKALTASSTLNPPYPSDPSDQLEKQRIQALNILADLNEQLLEVRSALVLPGTELPQSGKRKRRDGEVNEEYLSNAAKDSLALSDAQHPHMLSILNKWSNKINAASMAVNSKAAGSSKFLQGTKGRTGVVEAIEAGLANKRESGKTFMEIEESGYRLLLKEVIESRSGGGVGDMSHLRREKKKKRDAERGASKGRKISYTVHEKAQNFVVPIPLAYGWHDEQIDELFSSLLGAAGMKGGNAEKAISAAVNGGDGGEEGLTSLGGLRVF